MLWYLTVAQRNQILEWLWQAAMSTTTLKIRCCAWVLMREGRKRIRILTIFSGGGCLKSILAYLDHLDLPRGITVTKVQGMEDPQNATTKPKGIEIVELGQTTKTHTKKAKPQMAYKSPSLVYSRKWPHHTLFEMKHCSITMLDNACLSWPHQQVLHQGPAIPS